MTSPLVVMFIDFLGKCGRSRKFLRGSERVVLVGGRHGDK